MKKQKNKLLGIVILLFALSISTTQVLSSSYYEATASGITYPDIWRIDISYMKIKLTPYNGRIEGKVAFTIRPLGTTTRITEYYLWADVTGKNPVKCQEFYVNYDYFVTGSDPPESYVIANNVDTLTSYATYYSVTLYIKMFYIDSEEGSQSRYFYYQVLFMKSGTSYMYLGPINVKCGSTQPVDFVLY